MEEDFVKAVKATGKNNWIAGVVTEVCGGISHHSLWQKAFEVFVITDASALSTN